MSPFTNLKYDVPIYNVPVNVPGTINVAVYNEQNFRVRCCRPPIKLWTLINERAIPPYFNDILNQLHRCLNHLTT